ncbi:hypothetical protein BU24DRAFT_477420 [Aaosphaeria arxii CBS 175.79]|uniref:F-box domain-containing protein n=1 Tax=Aaosphaeria arxii CBS 175.79 TaxID=1450172 RepID=A0A6A5Y5E3_9PLEO|nr:uncharacterized protein BU24DRAFT_477420 [Aaosphaeria arxii CBS 175.79]KAF2020257.1 hypothetical protein BU24DRAFT_477420 [Aaosphaeria arxii CBS 175.79]
MSTAKVPSPMEQDATSILEESVKEVCISTRTHSLMELPAELRNRIYEYAQEDVPTSVIFPKVEEIDPNEKRNVVFGKGQPLQGIALAQVCTATRKEYRPMYLRACHFNLLQYHLSDFFKLFYPTWKDYENNPRRITVYFDPIPSPPLPKRPLFILPLFYMRNKSTRIEIKYYNRERPCIIGKLTKALLTRDNKTWQADIQAGNFDMISIEPTNWCILTRIVFTRQGSRRYEVSKNKDAENEDAEDADNEDSEDDDEEDEEDEDEEDEDEEDEDEEDEDEEDEDEDDGDENDFGERYIKDAGFDNFSDLDEFEVTDKMCTNMRTEPTLG